MLFYPEGTNTPCAPLCADGVKQAMLSEKIHESRALSCDFERQLHFKLGDIDAIMPYEECALGIREGTVRDIAILSRVGHMTCFVVKDFVVKDGKPCAILSRSAAQQKCKREHLDKLVPGDVIKAKVTHIESFGCFCDIGCGISALLPIDCMSVSRISTPADRFFEGQNIYCAIKNRDEKGRIVLSTKELFGTWLENAQNYHTGDTVLGVVRSIENYGVFIELAPNLAGLAELGAHVECGQTVSVHIKNINPEKMKIKLAVLSALNCSPPKCDNFYIKNGHIDEWIYSPEGATKILRTIF